MSLAPGLLICFIFAQEVCKLEDERSRSLLLPADKARKEGLV